MVQRKELFESLLKLLLVVICPLVSACEQVRSHGPLQVSDR